MKSVIQRVSSASVTINRSEKRSIGRGLVVLVAVGLTDTESDAQWLSQKIAGLRIFPNESGKFDRSVQEIGGELLVVSQFTLFADCSRGKRPDFISAARPEQAVPLYNKFVELLKTAGLPVVTGEFGADMLVEISNDGPVTIIIDTKEAAQ